MEEMISFMKEIDVLIAHNGIGYDIPALKKVLGFEFKGTVVDTLIMSRLLNPKRTAPPDCPKKNAPHSIEAWGYRVGKYKPDHDDWSRFSQEMLDRCEADVDILALVYDELIRESKGMGMGNAFKLSFELFGNLEKQRQYGWKVDIPHMEKCLRQLEKWIRWIDTVITPKLPLILENHEKKEADGSFAFVRKPFKKNGEYSSQVTNYYGSCCSDSNHPSFALDDIVGPFSRVSFRIVSLDSNDEIKDFLLEQGWEPKEWNTSKQTGERTSPKLSQDDEFEGIEGKLGKLVAKRLICKQKIGVINGWMNSIRKDGRIPSEINNMAVTGRLTHKTIANVPRVTSFFGKQMRKIFSSEEGMVLVGTDSDQCQLRMLASRANSKILTDAILNGRKEDGTDLHTINQKLIEAKNRDVAKTYIYAYLFAAGPGKIAKILECSVARAKEIMAMYAKSVDGLEELLLSLRKEWRASAKKKWNGRWNRIEYEDGYITGLDGRKILVPTERQLLVYLLQSDEAIMMTKAYNLLHERLANKYRWGIDYGVVCFYHDEYSVECKEAIAEDVRKISEQCIVDAAEYYKLSCPHKGGGNIGKNWYSIH